MKKLLNRRLWVIALLCFGFCWLTPSLLSVAQESGEPAAVDAPSSDGSTAASGDSSDSFVLFCWFFSLIAGLAALVQARLFYHTMIQKPGGTDLMCEIAGHVRDGADAYLRQQIRVIAAFFVLIAIVLAYAAYGLKVQNEFVPFAFITGGFFSGLAGWFGMKTATAASNRTAAAAQESLNQGLQVAFRSGAVMGLTVVGLGLVDISIWFCFLYWVLPSVSGVENAMTPGEISLAMLSFGMGASAQALFARVGGGIFTKAADVGADLVGKVEAGIPEDDPRNPATIADNVGDNVGDVAGMGADLYESYANSILASAALGAAAYAGSGLLPEGMASSTAQLRAMFLPMTIAAAGILLSIVGIYLVRTKEDASQKNLLAALARGINSSTILVAIAALGLAKLLMPPTEGTMIAGIPGVGFSVLVGLFAGWAIGKWTEYSTSDEFRPTRSLADQALTGPATIIIYGLADGMKSVWFPVITIGAAMLLAFGFASGWNLGDLTYFSLGLYGVGIAAVGMLSTLGITLATDAYGPIADNAGGNAEMSGLDPMVRKRTDALDSLGNTTAATGKGFAIGSAALTALALLAAYVEGVRGGLERWGDAVAEQYEDGTFVLSTRGFIIHKETDRTTVHVDKYLFLPHQRRDPAVQEAWDALLNAPAEGEGALSTGVTGVVTMDHSEEGHEHVFKVAATGEPLTKLEEATFADFMAYYDATIMNPKVLVGIFLGAMAVFVFCALTMKAVGRAAQGMVEEVRRQFREMPGILEGTAKPDYAAPVEISTRAAQREMVVPAVLGLLLPVVVGLLLGVGGMLGLLAGTLTCGFCVAIFMANAGGSWDNAKKYIEAGAHGGKGTDAHKAAVVGDTVGDPFKDTSGPSLNILIKLMSMVSVVIAGLVVRYSLEAMGLF